MTRVLFVCLGNICRSPMAHGAFRDLIRARGLEEKLAVDSCGTGGHHAGEPPNELMQRVAKARGIELSDLRSRQLCGSDFTDFDLLVAMDRENERDILRCKPEDARCKVVRFMQFVAGESAEDVPDPWWAGRIEGFELVCDLIDAGIEPLLRYALNPTASGVPEESG